ncbi:uncharacterized protein TNCV_233641 [Trichonephila clavipes]|nr:uncharacterized protein TNCV_233641 [Trichonephila clavipes]
MMNLTESAKRPSGKRPKKRKFTGNMHTRCKAVHSVDESLNNSASGKKIQLPDVDSSFIEHDDGFDGYRVFDKTIIFTNIQNFASCKKCGGDIKLTEKCVIGFSSVCSVECKNCKDLCSFRNSKMLGDKTGKCIDAEVMSSFCKGCDSWKRRKGSPAYEKWKILHVKECLKNHNGSAGMMETVGMVRIFQRLLNHRSVRYTSYIGDGDSKTFSSITVSNPYGEDITVSKIECIGHVQKRMGTRLRKLKQMSSKLSDGKSIVG